MPILISNTGLGGGLKVSGNSTGGFKARYVPFDLDAQAFFNRVFAAGGTLTSTEANAVNTLTIILKAVGVWTLMKAIYPMVGASAAACAQNLKSSSFTGIFNGGMTYSSNGILPNGSNAYMNTQLAALGNLTQNSTHLSTYIRGTNANNQWYMGARNGAGIENYILNFGYAAINSGDTAATAIQGQVGLFVNSRTTSTSLIQYKNSTALSTLVSASTGLHTQPIWIGGFNNNGTLSSPSNNQCAFATIGDGLSSTNVTDFYNAVQTFQTTLGRQV